MMQLFWWFSCAFLTLLLCALAEAVMAFDIVVYFNARSGVNWLSQNLPQYFSWQVPRSTALAILEPMKIPHLSGSVRWA